MTAAGGGAPCVDLHLHSYHSDGLDAPADVVARAAGLGFAAIALTDHDTLDGVPEAADAARAAQLGFLTGVEISTEFEGAEVHVTALGVRLDCEALNDRLEWLREVRRDRAAKILERLGACGVSLDHDTLAAQAGRAAPGRLHIARALLAAGVVGSAQEAFDRFLNPGLPAYVPRALLPVREAISHIHEAGGCAFVAHPGLSKTLRRVLPKLLALPFDGVEAYHVSHLPFRVKEYKDNARARGLLVAGGSDCHGGAKGAIEMGKVRVPILYFEAIEAALEARRRS